MVLSETLGLWRPTTFAPWPQASSRLDGSLPLCLALPPAERLAIDSVHPQARDHHRLASQRLSTLLEMEESASGKAVRLYPLKFGI